MKFVILIVALLTVVPLAGWLRRYSQESRKLWILMGILPFVITMGPHPLYIAIISWPGWPSYVKGTEVSAIDILALAIFLSQRRAQNPLPFRFSMAFYLFAILCSALSAQVPMAALFYPWQLGRMFLLYVVVARASTNERVTQSLLTGMALGLCLQAVLAIWDRVGMGVLQVGAGIGDKNLLGMITHFVIFPWFALLMAGERGWIPFATPLAGAVIAVLTVSRAALGLNGAGLALVLALSVLRRWTPRKAKVIFLSIATIVVLAPIAVSSLDRRFNDQPNSGDYDERAAFQKAAEMMISDHPMGVGANNYVVAANAGNYEDRAGVASVSGSRGTSVHNAYLLAAAETGYLGVAALMLLLLRPLIAAFHCGWRDRKDPRGDLLIGLGVSLLIVYIHSFFEWIFFTFQIQYLLAITLGLIAGLTQQLGYWQRGSNHGARFETGKNSQQHGMLTLGESSISAQVF